MAIIQHFQMHYLEINLTICRGYPAKRALLPCISMAGSALLAGYPQCLLSQWSSLVQLMAYCLFSTKPLPESTTTYCKFDPREQISVKSESKQQSSIKKMHFKIFTILFRPHSVNLPYTLNSVLRHMTTSKLTRFLQWKTYSTFGLGIVFSLPLAMHTSPITISSYNFNKENQHSEEEEKKIPSENCFKRCQDAKYYSTGCVWFMIWDCRLHITASAVNCGISNTLVLEIP